MFWLQGEVLGDLQRAAEGPLSTAATPKCSRWALGELLIEGWSCLHPRPADLQEGKMLLNQGTFGQEEGVSSAGKGAVREHVDPRLCDIVRSSVHHDVSSRFMTSFL